MLINALDHFILGLITANLFIISATLYKIHMELKKMNKYISIAIVEKRFK
jgi:hypothetical protein